MRETDSKSGSGSGNDSSASLFDDEPVPAAVLANSGRDAQASGATAFPASGSNPSLRILSLKAIDRILAGCPASPLCQDTLFLTLGGITNLSGLAFDERFGDVLLFGEVRKGEPALHLDDLVVALRNAWLAFIQQKGNRITYLHPGISLEPAPAAMKELQKIALEIANINETGGEKALERWKETCRKPYKVVVTGLPSDSRFADALLRADYGLKAVANGSEDLGIHGFPGMAELRKIRFQGDQSQGKSPAPPLPSLTRYWFHPGTQEWEMGEGIVVLKRCQIMLMTEEMFERIRKDTADTTAPGDDVAEAFAYGFTRMFEQVAEIRPVYRELEGLFRLVAAAKLVRDRYPEGDAKVVFPALFQGYRPKPVAVGDQMAGLPELQHFDHARSTSMGMEIDRYWLPSCGGINVAVEPAKAWVRRLRDQRLSNFRKAAIASRPEEEGAWHWEVDGSPLDYWSVLRERMRMQDLCQRFPNLAFYRLRRTAEDNGRALELVDEDDHVIISGQAKTLLEDIAIRAEARKVHSVFLEMSRWPADQAAEFTAAASTYVKYRKASWTLVPVVDRPGWLQVRNPIFTHSADWEQGEPPLETVNFGVYKGWSRLTFRFLTTAGGKTVPASLHVMVKSQATAARLQEEAVKAFRTKLFIAYSPLSALIAVIDEFREDLPPPERKDVKIVEDEAGLVELG